MTSPDRVGDTLRKAMAVPTDTMITLDLPLLLTRLSQIPVRRDPLPAVDAVTVDRTGDGA